MEHLTQRITVNSNPNLIFSEMVKWSESEWWPEIPMEFVKLSQSTIEPPLFLQKARVILGPQWHTRVDSIDREKCYIKRSFLDGMFKGGYEEIYLEGNGERKELVYIFSYPSAVSLGRLLWKALFKNMHLKNISVILNSLKEFAESRGK